MTEARRIVFYGDLNCPFCFVQNERLTKYGFQHVVEWRGVEHMPDLPRVSALGDTPKDLHDELLSVGHRAPDVHVHRPAFRPNTLLATSAIASVKDPSAAATIRTRIYRALWHDGLDIADPAVIRELFAQASQPAPPIRPHPDVNVWTKEWREGPFDARIPSMRARNDELLLGLADEQTLRDFVWRSRGAADPNATCSAD